MAYTFTDKGIYLSRGRVSKIMVPRDTGNHNNATLLIDGKVYTSLNQPSGKETFAVQCFASHDDRFCLPSWIIVAGGKSGSSSLWQYLCDNIASQCSTKEIHYHGGPLVPFIQQTMGQNESFGSGNMGMLEPLKDFLLRNSNTKFITLLRNPIDWSYAAWHFWCNPLFDGPGCTEGMWATRLQSAIPRTPENFERLLENHCADKSNCFVNSSWRNWFAAGNFLDSVSEDRFLVVRSEELAENVSGVLERLWRFLGLPNQLRHPDIVEKAFNTGKMNGVDNGDEIKKALGMSYEPMTVKSRAILCQVIDYWSRLSYFVNKYQIKLHQADLEACQ